MAESMKTYIMQIKGQLRIKIGRSKCPISRRNAIQTSHQDYVMLIGIIDGDIEQELHAMFSKQRIPGGEWFNVDEDVAGWFASERRIHKLGKLYHHVRIKPPTEPLRIKPPIEPRISHDEVCTLLNSAFQDYKFQAWSHGAFCKALDEAMGFMGCVEDCCEGEEDNFIRPDSDMTIADAQDLYDTLHIACAMEEHELQEEFAGLQYLGLSPDGVIAIGWPSRRITRRRTLLDNFAHIYGSCDIVGFPLFLFYILSLGSHLELMEVNLFGRHFQYPMPQGDNLFIKICFADGSTKAFKSAHEPSAVMC